MNRRRFAASMIGTLAWGGCRTLLAADPAPDSGQPVTSKAMIEFDGNFFVSLLLATAEMNARDGDNADPSVFGDPNGLAGILIISSKANARLKVTARAGEFWEGGDFSCLLPAAGEKYWIAPRLHYRYDVLRALKAPKACAVTFALEVDGVAVADEAVKGTVHPFNECVYGTSISAGFVDKTGVKMYAGYGWLFAAYMDEEHPFIVQLVKEALETGIVREFDAYQSGDGDQVLLQTYAIWVALTRRGGRFHDVMATTLASEFVVSERVRSLDEIAAKPSGTSAEAVMVLASALLRIGLRPFVLIVEERIQLAVNRSENEVDFVGIEPTFMGLLTAPASWWPGELRDSLPEPFREAPSLAAFGAALADGTDDVVSYKRQFQDIDPHWQLIDIRQARKDGIQPFRKVVAGK